MADFNVKLLDKDTFIEKMDNVVTAIIGSGSGSSGGNTQLVTTWKDVQNIVRMGLGAKNFPIGTIFKVAHESNVTATGSSELTVTIDPVMFVTKVGTSNPSEYEFVYDGTVWKLHDEEVVMGLYGLTISGSPTNSSTIVVVVSGDYDYYRVVQHDRYTPVNPQLTHTMTLESVYTVTSMQFKASQLMYVASESLPAGKYKFTLNHGAYGGGTAEDGTYVFTTTQAIPVNGGFRHSSVGAYRSTYDASNILGAKITTYGAIGSSGFTAIESNLTVTAYDSSTDSGATDLGTFTANDSQYMDATTYPNNNFTEKVAYGSNDPLYNDIDLWMNSDNNGSTTLGYWSQQTKWDMPNNLLGKGYKYGLENDFLNVTCECKIPIGYGKDKTSRGVTNKNLVFFLASMNELSFNIYTDEGSMFDWYKNYVSATATNDALPARIKRNKQGTAQYFWSRTAYRGYANYVYIGTVSGAHNYHSAYYTFGVAPLVNIG